MASRPWASAGMPSSSSVRQTRPPPYFFTRGRMVSRLSSFPLTEFTGGLPLYRRRAASMAAGLEVSSCRGSPVTSWMASTVWVSTAGSSRPGRPTLTSKMWAPASSCWKTSPIHTPYPPPAGRFGVFLSGGIDPLPDDDRVPAVQGHRLTVGGDQQGIPLGNLRQRNVLGGLDQRPQVVGGGPTAPPQKGGHGGQRAHLPGIVGRAHIVHRFAPLAARQARVGLEEQGVEVSSHKA